MATLRLVQPGLVEIALRRSGSIDWSDWVDLRDTNLSFSVKDQIGLECKAEGYYLHGIMQKRWEDQGSEMDSGRITNFQRSDQ